MNSKDFWRLVSPNLSPETPHSAPSAPSEPLVGDAATDDFLPERDCFFLSANRHDRDRIEIQIGFDGQVPKDRNRNFSYDFDCTIFMPKSLGVVEMDDPQNIRHDFQSYIRLHTHVSDPKSANSMLRVRERLQQVKDRLSLETLRIFAIEFESYLKAQTKRVKNRSVGAAPLATEIEAIQFLVNEFRSIIKARNLEGRRAEDFARRSVDQDVLLLNEYVSHLLIQYLVEVDSTCRMSADLNLVVPTIYDFLESESETRKTYHFLIENNQGPEKFAQEELYLRRISMLKKYFQKAVFVNVIGATMEKRLLIPVYGISAALAGSWAIMVQIYEARNFAERVGINSIALISLGVVAYVCKDIMKDFFRRSLFRTGSRLFPDYDKKLFIQNGDKEMRLGSIKEYIRAFDSDEIPADLAQARYAEKDGELEESLHEDVIQFKKRVTLRLSSLDSRKNFPWGLREILRFRFDRLLSSMEDPFKNVHLVSETGQPVTRQGHRIYQIYFAAWIQIDPRSPDGAKIKPAFKAFRVTLDKTGILDCHQLNWKKNGRIPTAP